MIKDNKGKCNVSRENEAEVVVDKSVYGGVSAKQASKSMRETMKILNNRYRYGELEVEADGE